MVAHTEVRRAAVRKVQTGCTTARAGGACEAARAVPLPAVSELSLAPSGLSLPAMRHGRCAYAPYSASAVAGESARPSGAPAAMCASEVPPACMRLHSLVTSSYAANTRRARLTSE